MLVNAWSLDRMARRHTERWVLLVALASLGGPLALAASTYASLTEWCVSMVDLRNGSINWVLSMIGAHPPTPHSDTSIPRSRAAIAFAYMARSASAVELA